MADSSSNLKARLHEIIFEADTPAGKAFDVVLLILIVLSVVAVMLESVASISARYGTLLARVRVVLHHPVHHRVRAAAALRRQAAAVRPSFFGIVVDLWPSCPPTSACVLPGAQSCLVIRALRLLRVFRVLKLAHYRRRGIRTGGRPCAPARRKIIVFLGTVLTLVVIVGSLMYVIEGEANGFTSIPRSDLLGHRHHDHRRLRRHRAPDPSRPDPGLGWS